VLSIAGAVVTSDGGMLSHAAVLARELGIPAVIGVSGALSIQDGSTIEVDAAAGLIRVIAPA
jgi:phosphohistidine swiveling domain-containing protein